MTALAVTMLDDKWTVQAGRVMITGAQAIGRLLLAQKSLDRRAGLNTAGYISGYRGSPLGNVDSALWAMGERLAQADIVFQPGVNEDLAATAVRGTQQLDAVPGARFDGVFAAWYGKGPGVDRCGDAFRHGNIVGAHKHGGVVVFYGDDHVGKSSTVSHQSEQAMAASVIPSFYPSDVAELIAFGLLGFAMSRYSGSWVGVKCVNEVAEQTQTVTLDLENFAPVLPPRPEGAPDIHARQGLFDPLGEERLAVEQRLPLVHQFVRANGVDRLVFEAPTRGLGVVCAGKTYGDVLGALALLGLDESAARRAGISLYKVGCVWPLEPEGLRAFAEGHPSLLVVEEKKSLIELQAAALLVNQAQRPLVLGKIDETGAPLLSSVDALEPGVIARAIQGRLQRLGRPLALAGMQALSADARDLEPSPLRRSPYFCSGCPHNRSTKIPEGSLSMTGIGCHTMVNFVRPAEALLPTQMGGEGANWLGMAPFTATPHMFQNMGDGTYFHSGLLAIRAAVSAGANITYKILYNDAVAMTGGQPVDGSLSPEDIAQQVTHEGVTRVVLLSEDPERYRRRKGLPKAVHVGHRDELEDVQKQLRETAGCTVLIYEQTCAAEKRRRRKRGKLADPPQRLHIAKSVCEGCGDCSVQSTCVSLTPVETELGVKRAIDQASCNKDFSCLNGFCPSFLTIRGAEPRRPKAVTLDEDAVARLPIAPMAATADGGAFNLMIAGIGGTGVVTVGALVGMAAHLEGRSATIFDMTGLAQKNGAVFSHVRIAEDRDAIASQRIHAGQADLVLAFDLVAALAADCADAIARGRTRVVANTAVAPTSAFQFGREPVVARGALTRRMERLVGEDHLVSIDAQGLATQLFGDTVAANLLLLGVAQQNGLLPVSAEALEQAITLNGVAVKMNRTAFRLGRLYAADPEAATAGGPAPARPAPIPQTVDELIDHRSAHLTLYQGSALAARYRALVDRVAQAEQRVSPGSTRLVRAAAGSYAKLLAYKDEYEVARLLSDPALRAEIRAQFQDGGRISFNLAPPFLGEGGPTGRPRKREFGAWMLPIFQVLARLRGLRGTAFDPFGRTPERQLERALIAEYEALVDEVLDLLTGASLDGASRLLALADQVRGYGPVKHESATTYRRAIAEALRVDRAPGADAPIAA